MTSSHLEPLASLPDIRRIARGSLNAAGALDVLPVPLADVASAVQLSKADLFAIGEDAPPSILAIARKLGGRVLGLLSIPEKVIYVDPSLSPERGRFTEAHEIGHHALPWHEGAYYGDDRATLSSDTRVHLEREANAFSAELLFGAGAFSAEANDYAPGIEVALALHGKYQVSIAATLRHYVEHSSQVVALVVTGNYANLRGMDRKLPVFRTQCAESTAFTKRYGSIHAGVPNELSTTTMPAARALLEVSSGLGVTSEVVLETSRGAIRFTAETFTNGYLRYMLIYKASKVSGRRIELVQASGLGLF